MSRALLLTTALGVLGASAGACRGQTSGDPPIILLRNMHFQQRYNAQARSEFFADHRTMRVPVEDTVAHDGFIDDDRVTLGHETDSAAYVMTVPESVAQTAGGMAPLVDRGHDRFGIYCTPCHGRLGDGNGIVFLRSRLVGGYQYPQPASFHTEANRHMPDGQLYATITNGIRNMPSYAAQIPVQDRWAIVAYVRALQLSQLNTPPTGATP